MLLVTLLATAGCTNAHPRSPAAGVRTDWYEVRFRSAALTAMRSCGQPWHVSEGDDSAGVLGGLLGLAVGYPELGAALGSALVDDPQPTAPAPFVTMKVAGTTYRVEPIGQTLSPAWKQPIAIPGHAHDEDAVALVQVFDAVDGGLLGQATLPTSELLRPGTHLLADVGEVASLEIEVHAMAARSPLVDDVRIPSTKTLSDLKSSGAEGWKAIPVWNGDRITIHASGRICPASFSPDCFGPDGAEPGRWTNHNYRDFADAPHASLVAMLPGQRVRVGSAATFVADEAGLLLLFLNDDDVGNNSGELRARRGDAAVARRSGDLSRRWSATVDRA